ncbi:FtsX-like permease family protein [Shewanella corallii]|uniref:FtsX-like permease family protein n=1 Tax=Shewanella corallii TaxID=560080 RepID=A0ABT0N231_9GAMM|nr:ABC transporter permease [Shewanella corallii]MCL2912482.1 FtsX-like permease family protein [Shewanella corallii]
MSSALNSTMASLRVFAAHYRHKPLQAGAILLGIVLAVTLLTGVKSTNENAVRSYSQATELLSRQATAYILPPGTTGTLNQTQYFKLRQAGLPVLAVIDGHVMDDKGRRWHITGSDIIAATALASGHQTESSSEEYPMVPMGRLLSAEPVAMLSQNLVDRIKTVDGSASLNLASTQVTLLPQPDSAALGNNVLMDISFAQQLLGRQGRLSYIALMTEDESQLALARSLLIDNNTLRLGDQGEALTELTASFHLNLQAMAMLAFVVGLFIAYNGIRYSLMKRQRLMLKLLQAGITRKALMSALLLELIILVHLGSAIGFVLGLQLSQWLQPMVAMTLEQLYDARILPGHWQLAWLMEAIALTLAAALLACVPLYRALTNQSLARAGMQYSQNLIHYRSYRLQFLLACGLIALAAILILISSEYQYSLALLGLLTLAFPLLLPQLMLWLTSALEKVAPKGSWHYLVAETRELTAPMALAMMALLLALSANVSMNTLVGSFEQTLKTWMDNRLHTDLYIRPHPTDADRIETWLRGTDGVDPVAIQWEAYSYIRPDITDEADRHRVMLLSRDDAAMLETVSLKDSASNTEQAEFWPDFFAGESLMLSEPLALRHNIKVGDRLLLEATENLYPQGLPVGAIYYDYGKPIGEVMISEKLWHQAGMPGSNRNFAVGWRGDTDELQTMLKNQGVSPAMMYSQSKIKKEAIKMFKRTFSITVVLNSLTLLVAAIGLFSASMMLMQSRQAPLARLYALGVSRPRLFAMVSVQMLLMVLITALLSLPTGVVLGWLLIHKVTLQAFGWSIAMVWDWWAYLQVVLLALVACALAVFIPLIQQTRRPLISSLQQEVL